MARLDIPMDHPRPAFFREEWENLNGSWEFAFDDKDRGIVEHWERKHYDMTITVPFCYQSLRSGIGDKTYHPIAWYKRNLEYRDSWAEKKVLLHFEGVDYRFDLWINENHVGSHRGGNIRSTFEISNWLHVGSNDICLRVSDHYDWSKPQGKQAPIEKIDRCWYTQTTGIWKSVWIEIVPELYLSSIKITPNIDRREVALDIELNQFVPGIKLHCDIHYHDKQISKNSVAPQNGRFRVVAPVDGLDYVDEIHYWTPEHPELFDLYLTLETPTGAVDFVQTYFGMRKVEAREGAIYLNNRPYYLRLVLDQGYWQDSLMTPPENDSLKKDILLTKSFGFNGARKHQKIEDERYYYWADQLGLLVWAEMPSSYEFCTKEISAFTEEWVAVVSQLQNYPCIMMWVPFNESWGIRNILTDRCQQAFAVSAYHLTKALDDTRLVSTNDGWEQVTSDICGIHDYFDNANTFRKKYKDMDRLLASDAQGRKIYADGFSFTGQPIIISEYGGIAYGKAEDGAWGYNSNADNQYALLDRIKDVTLPILESKQIAGYCYTQLTDVMQEINGLANANHEPKVDFVQTRDIFG